MSPPAVEEEPHPTDLSARILRRLPAIEALRGYNARKFSADLFAGLTVATVAVPQGLAYAIVAGLPPQYGLYTAIVMTTVGAIFDSSRQLINGPTNAISIAVFSALAAVPEVDRVEAAILLALMIGLIQLGITLLKLGDLTRYVSHSVIVGFTLGAAVLLFIGQFRVTLGIPEGGTAQQSFLMRAYLTYASGPKINYLAAGIAAATIALTVAIDQLNRVLLRFGRFRLPSFLLAVIASGAAVATFGLQDKVAVIGSLPQSLPQFEVPTVTLTRIQHHAPQALAIALLGLLEAIAMAKAIAAYTRQKIDVGQQCLSEALANTAGSFFQCYPGSGSLTRSALNHQAGGVTQWSGVISAAGVATAILVAAPLAAYVPRAAIAGILLITALRLVDRRDLVYFVRTSRFDAIIVAATAVAAVAISVEFCLLVGVLLSFLLYVPRAGAIHLIEMSVVGPRLIRERSKKDPDCNKLVIFALEGEMFFGAVPDLEKHLALAEERVRQGAKVIVLRVRELRNPDAVCIQLLDHWVERIKKLGGHVLIAGVLPDMETCLEKSGAVERIGRDSIFLALHGPPSGLVRAVERAYEILGTDRCSTCPHDRISGLPSAGWHQEI
jgi:sulfate permease, SulP family